MTANRVDVNPHPRDITAWASIPKLMYPIKNAPYRRIDVSRFVAGWTSRALNRLTVHGSPQPATEDAGSEKDLSPNPSEAHLIKFARFNNGKLELFEAKPDELAYVAFSHVWGNWEWRQVPGIPYEIKASQEKANFIANDLPALVGEGAFWMDTLTVDQRDEKEVLAIVDSIPTIFKHAKRTIAVREPDGIYDCCIKAVEGFQDYKEFGGKLNKHQNMHADFVFEESYLQRLWTLQECLLSHTIQFVVGNSNTPSKRRVDMRTGDHIFYRCHIDSTVIQDLLWTLAFCFSGSEEGSSGITKFLKAYVHGGVVVNPKNPLRAEEEDIHSDYFVRVNLASRRSATKPRDYIFATMPQFPWYKYPREQALSMTFGEIYMDLYQQSADAGHAFTCRFTRSMLDPEDNDPTTAWLPSKHQPSPRCLGDFLKLMGHRVPDISNGKSRHVHLTSVVQAMEFCCSPEADQVLLVLQETMGLFQQQWQESHRGGEISKYGNFPSPEWTLDHIDAMKCGWMCKNPEWGIRVLDAGADTVMTFGPSLEYDEDYLIQDLCSVDEFDNEAREAGSDHVSLFEQTSRILDHMWCAHDPMQINPGQESDWRTFKAQMRGAWSPPLLRTMLLISAMIACRIPLSAAAWVNRLFVPVYVVYGNGLIVIGLLAKTARQEESARNQPRRMYSVGQHLPAWATQGLQFGKDHFLVDPVRKVPVGILPDFLPDERTDEEYAKITSDLYAGFCQVMDGNQVAIMTAPLFAVNETASPS